MKLWDSFVQNFILFILALGSYLFYRWSTSFKNKKLKLENLEKSVNRDAEINQLLKNLRWTLNAKRAYLSQLHDGDKDGPILFTKKTRTHEAVEEGTNYQEEYYKGVLISTVTDEMKLVTTEGPAYTLVKNLAPGKFKYLNMNGGAKAIARCAVMDYRKNVIGFVGVDFANEIKPSDEELDKICICAGQIGEMLQ